MGVWIYSAPQTTAAAAAAVGLAKSKAAGLSELRGLGA